MNNNNKNFNKNGVLLLDKPKGFSCNYILQIIKRILNIKKAGYIGTLDPLATGILPICLGDATKFIKYLNTANKKYMVIVKLGEKTNTSDSYGYVTNKKKINFCYTKIYKYLKKFYGNNKQIPSMYSAIKIYGIPLYLYARQNILIPRDSRIINIYNINILNIKDNIIKFKIFCSKGTYIRTIVEDLGNILGCGAHIIMLRRLQISFYYESNLISYKKFLNISKNMYSSINFYKNILYPTESLVSYLPKIYISNNQLRFLKYGHGILILNLNIGFYAIFKIFTKKFLGVGKIKKNNYLYSKNLI